MKFINDYQKTENVIEDKLVSKSTEVEEAQVKLKRREAVGYGNIITIIYLGHIIATRKSITKSRPRTII